MLRLVLVRHGESIRNYLTDLAREGDTEPLVAHMRDFPEEPEWPLTDVGKHQAQLAGDFLRHTLPCDFEKGFVSPFVRARQTADLLGLPLDWRVDDRLRERLWGDYPTNSYTVSEYLGDLHHCAEANWRAPFPNAESVSDLEDEAASFLLDVQAKRSIIAVTHGGTIGAFQLVIERTPPHRALGNCGVLEYHITMEEHGWAGRARHACPAFGDKEFSEWNDFGPRANPPEPLSAEGLSC
jgi:broad specificity phosphatase PhoE